MDIFFLCDWCECVYECAWYHNTFLVHLSLGDKVVLYCIVMTRIANTFFLFLYHLLQEWRFFPLWRSVHSVRKVFLGTKFCSTRLHKSGLSRAQLVFPLTQRCMRPFWCFPLLFPAVFWRFLLSPSSFFLCCSFSQICSVYQPRTVQYPFCKQHCNCISASSTTSSVAVSYTHLTLPTTASV